MIETCFIENSHKQSDSIQNTLLYYVYKLEIYTRAVSEISCRSEGLKKDHMKYIYLKAENILLINYKDKGVAITGDYYADLLKHLK